LKKRPRKFSRARFFTRQDIPLQRDTVIERADAPDATLCYPRSVCYRFLRTGRPVIRQYRHSVESSLELVAGEKNPMNSGGRRATGTHRETGYRAKRLAVMRVFPAAL